MSEQRNDAAERSAHVLRGGDAKAGGLHPILETKNEAGQTVGQLRVVVELRTQNARLREVVEHYADLFCEWGAAHECCGKLSDDECSGCKARAALSSEPRA